MSNGKRREWGFNLGPSEAVKEKQQQGNEESRVIARREKRLRKCKRKQRPRSRK